MGSIFCIPLDTGARIVGLPIIAVATLLPNASAIAGAMRDRRHELAAPGQSVIKQAGGIALLLSLVPQPV